MKTKKTGREAKKSEVAVSRPRDGPQYRLDSVTVQRNLRVAAAGGADAIQRCEERLSRLGAPKQHRLLKEYAMRIGASSERRVDRDAQRCKPILLCWFVENWDIVERQFYVQEPRTPPAVFDIDAWDPLASDEPYIPANW